MASQEISGALGQAPQETPTVAGATALPAASHQIHGAAEGGAGEAHGAAEALADGAGEAHRAGEAHGAGEAYGAGEAPGAGGLGLECDELPASQDSQASCSSSILGDALLAWHAPIDLNPDTSCSLEWYAEVSDSEDSDMESQECDEAMTSFFESMVVDVDEQTKAHGPL